MKMKFAYAIRDGNSSLIQVCTDRFRGCLSTWRGAGSVALTSNQTAPDRDGCKSLFSAIGFFAPLASTLLAILLLAPPPGIAQARVQLPHTALTPEDIAVIINDSDPLSRQIGSYYQKARHIPEGNVIHLEFPTGHSALSREEFQQLKAEIDQMVPAHVQAYAVAWTLPYRVDCMSLTSALAFGFDESFCSPGCGPTQASPYFNSSSVDPAGDHQLRPAMMLAGVDFEQVKALIDRGIAADHSFPHGSAYLVITPDKERSVRANYFELAAKELAGVFPIEILETEAISDRHDVLFYFTGSVHVPQLHTLDFLPGALADHLTSAGGQLTDSNQMSSLRWLEAGATASYGTVVEPCSHIQKFPFPAIAMFHYALGASAIEAYWKSVAWPGEGVFVGEPLARPFAPELRQISAGQYELHVFSPSDRRLRFERSRSAAGPFKPLAQRPRLRRGVNTVRFNFAETEGYLRLRW
jgi:uncharacterized protein (TIGR03790 family)